MENYRQNADFKRRILVVEDEEVNREILGEILGESYLVSYAENGLQAWDMLHDHSVHYSLVLLDLLMPKMGGIELLEKLRLKEHKMAPVIVMTADETAELTSIKLGAADFLTKPYDMPEVILARCERLIELYEDQSLISAAERDLLSGLYSKEFFYEYIRQIESYQPDRKKDAITLDIEHFHMLNEMFGREAGDEVLRTTGKILTEIFGSRGIGCRPVADVFFLYVDHAEQYDGVFAGLQEELARVTGIPRIRFRIGICQDVDKSLPCEVWFDHAKHACDVIRGDYTRQISFYNEETNAKDLYRERLIKDMDEALSHKDFVVYYQPKYDVSGSRPRLRSAEALIRWKHPELGMISPGDFIPLFESNGLIMKLDNYVWQEAAAQVKEWKDEFGLTLPVSVNVSRIDIYDPALEDKLLDLLRKNGLNPEEIMLEITESAYSSNAQGLIETVNHLRETGFRIEMDDFGSGYSSLNMLTTIPIDVLKMDMKFIRNMMKDRKSQKLVELVIDIARFLEVPVVAEGVETEEQLQLLQEMGCDIIQGYFFSKPVPPEEFRHFIEKELGEKES